MYRMGRCIEHFQCFYFIEGNDEKSMGYIVKQTHVWLWVRITLLTWAGFLTSHVFCFNTCQNETLTLPCRVFVQIKWDNIVKALHTGSSTW